MPTSPNVMNYHIGKGIVSFKETGDSTFTDLGNSPSFIYTPAVTKKEHFSSREGVKTKDFTAITQVGATIKFTLDEITGANLAFFALADTDTTTPGQISLSGLSKAEFTGDIKVVGTNDIGQHVDFTATVSFVPSGDFSFITDQDNFSVITIEAEVMKNSTTNDFGVWTVHDASKSVTAATVAAGGTGYTVGNTITLSSGVILTVATVSAGAVLTTTITNHGSATTPPTNPVAQVSTSGTGTGATFNLTWA